jgi:uncharacterized membrane protein
MDRDTTLDPVDPDGYGPGALREVEPAREDTLVRGLSEAIGGPLGEHAVRRSRGSDRIWTPVRIIMALACMTFGLHWIQKSYCQDHGWSDYSQYTHFCYTDVLALYYAEELYTGKVPYFQHNVEYPVLTGYLMGAIGLPVHKLTEEKLITNDSQVFYNLNAVVLSACGLAAIAVTLALRRRRPWDAALFALAPTLYVTATVNWDLFVVALTAFFFLAWHKQRSITAGIMLGLATAAKFYPLFIAGPLLLLALRTGRWRPALISVGTGVATWAAVNAPVFFGARQGWLEFFNLNQTRGVDWGTFWYFMQHAPFAPEGGFGWFNYLSANIPTLNLVTWGLFLLCCVGITALTLGAKRRPRLAQLAFLVVAAFLLTSKVWSQQYCLWLLPLAVLARPKWGAFLLWQVAEVCYFFAFYAELLNVSGKNVMPEMTFVYAAIFRWVMVVVMCGFIIRDILRPEQDVVRRTYDDPDGGAFDGASDVFTIRHPVNADDEPLPGPVAVPERALVAAT